MITDLQPGYLLDGKYLVVGCIGRGGMGAVYEARNALGRRFAVKVLTGHDLLSNTSTERFFREAQAAAAVESENVIQVFDTGIDEATGAPYIILELLKGQDLERLLVARRLLAPLVAIRIAAQAASGVARAHERGIVHRDIKPANIFLSESDTGAIRVKLLDFGIAKLLETEQAETGLTRSGTMMGTPRYMCPEQAQDFRHVDKRADIWSLGMCLYQMLAGRLPYDGPIETFGQMLLTICTQPAERLERWAPWIPTPLADVVHACLEREPNARLPSAGMLVERLRAFAQGTFEVHVRDLSDSVRSAGEPSSNESVAPGGTMRSGQHPSSSDHLGPPASSTAPTVPSDQEHRPHRRAHRESSSALNAPEIDPTQVSGTPVLEPPPRASRPSFASRSAPWMAFGASLVLVASGGAVVSRAWEPTRLRLAHPSRPIVPSLEATAPPSPRSPSPMVSPMVSPSVVASAPASPPSVPSPVPTAVAPTSARPQGVSAKNRVTHAEVSVSPTASSAVPKPPGASSENAYDQPKTRPDISSSFE